MLETGRVVEATVTKVLPYGICCESSSDSVLVLANNMSWRGENSVDDVTVGDVVDVMIVGYNSVKQIYIGSCKDVRPEANPYIPLSLSSPTDTHRGTVRIVHKTGLAIQVGNCIGTLRYDDDTKELAVGDQISVEVESVDLSRQFLQLRMAGNSDKSEIASSE